MVERDTRFGGNLELANRSAGIASLAKSESDWQRANQEFRSFHTRTDPTAPEVIRDFGSPKHAGQFNWQVPSADYYQNMRESNQNLMDYRKNQMRDMILGPNKIYSNEPGIQAGITNPNLGGAKVWQAGGVGDWFNYAKRFTPWYDPEQDYWRHEQYQKENPKDVVREMDKNRALREYNEENYPPSVLNYYTHGPVGMDASLIPDYTSDFELDMLLEDLEPQDLGVKPKLEVRSRYKKEYDKKIRELLKKMKIKDAIIELAPKWGNQPYKGFNYKMANRGGLMSLV